MPRVRRVVVPGLPHHVTQRGVRSMDVFRDEVDRALYLTLMREHGRRSGVEFLAWCLMTNHVHLIVVPKREDSLARGIGEAHRPTRARATSARGCADTYSRAGSARACWTAPTWWRRRGTWS